MKRHTLLSDHRSIMPSWVPFSAKSDARGERSVVNDPRSKVVEAIMAGQFSVSPEPEIL